jgi:hypothetical protein
VGGQANGIVDDVYNYVRVVVVEATDSLVAADWAAVTMQTPPVRMAWPKVMRVIHDQTICLAVYGLDSTGYIAKAIQKSITIPLNQLLEYDSTGATDHLAKTIWLGLISDSAAVVNPGCVFPSHAWIDFRAVD